MPHKVIIPARLNSTRLPRKPMMDIYGKTLLQRVVEQARKSDAESIYVATDSDEICELCNLIDVNSILTSEKHESGTDRVFEACNKLDLKDDEIVVNVQGDEPFIDPEDINNLASFCETKDAEIATLYADLSKKELNDRNVVKLWINSNNQVLDFSREISHLGATDAKKHLGIYAYRYDFLKSFVEWEQSTNEQLRKLEQMRAMDNGQPIYATEAFGEIHLGVDTQSDLNEAIKIAKNM